MLIANREHAAQQLMAFLTQVGPLEAVWAMTTALEALNDLPASEDHVAAAAQAFSEEQAEVSEMAEAAAASAAKGSRGKKAPEGEKPAEGEQA